MTECPCKDCVVFARCNSLISAGSRIDGVLIVLLSVRCDLLHNFLTVEDPNQGKIVQSEKINATKCVFDRGLR